MSSGSIAGAVDGVGCTEALARAACGVDGGATGGSTGAGGAGAGTGRHPPTSTTATHAASMPNLGVRSVICEPPARAVPASVDPAGTQLTQLSRLTLG
jgi:hypothetical protein